ncbi:MAG TPA: glycosyltransferase [Rhizomicrobium sp.]|nr:glycosyltransferase [Rhizomicrobium sp.]
MQPSGKTLFISHNFPPVVGGSSVVYEQICRNAAQSIIALAARRDHTTGKLLRGLAEHDSACGYRVYRVDRLRTDLTMGTQQFRHRWIRFLLADVRIMLSVLYRTAWLVIKHRIRVVCIGELVAMGWLVLPLRYIFGRTVIIYTHGEEIAQDSHSLSSRLRQLNLRHANGIVSVSLFCKSLIVSRFAVPPAKIAVIYSGVDPGGFGPHSNEREGPGLEPGNRKIVLAVGRLVERKGLDRLVAAMPHVLREVPDAHCIIVGEGPLYGALADQIRRVGLESNVTLWGYASDEEVRRMYAAADLFVLPCRTLPDGDTEGFGLVFLEAAASKTPVIAGAAGGTVEAVVDRETGLVVNGDDPREIARAMIRLFTDKNLAKEFAEAGWRRAQKFTWPKAAAEFVSFSSHPNSRTKVPPSYPEAHRHEARLSNSPVRLLVTMDVEEQFDWSRFSRTNFTVGGTGELEAFQAACCSLGIIPVYVLTRPVLSDGAAGNFFRTLASTGEAETGIHLHVWTTPPYWEEPNEYNSYQCNLPHNMEMRKLQELTNRFADVMGFRPLIHRAGRWGGSARTARLLKQLGYKIDLSPAAGFSDPKGIGPDFQKLNGRPFWCDSDRNLLVVPASSLAFGRGPAWLSSLRRGRLGQRLARIRGKPLRFSPEGQEVPQLKSMARELARSGCPVAVFNLHSSSLIANGNPYSRTAADAAAMLRNSADILQYCIETLGMRPTSCDALFTEARNGG